MARRAHSNFLISFQAFLRNGELRIARCAKCRHPLNYAQRICPKHPRVEPEWIPANGRAKVLSCVTYRISYTDAMPPPYDVALIELAEGPRIVCRITDAAPGMLKAGASVRVATDASGRLTFAPTQS